MIPKDKWFFFKNGRHASTIEELSQALEWLGDDEFRFHVNMQRNDFANWVEDVFHEVRLAHSMREVAERDGLLIILGDFLMNKSKNKMGKGKEMKEIKQVIKQVKELKEEKELKEGKKQKAKGSLKRTPIKSLYEKKLSEKDIRNIVEDAQQVLDQEELEILKERVKTEDKIRHQRFVVKEFIYGFIIGLLFGMIMFGILYTMGVLNL